jgi:hypothetical protein
MSAQVKTSVWEKLPKLEKNDTSYRKWKQSMGPLIVKTGWAPLLLTTQDDYEFLRKFRFAMHLMVLYDEQDDMLEIANPPDIPESYVPPNYELHKSENFPAANDAYTSIKVTLCEELLLDLQNEEHVNTSWNLWKWLEKKCASQVTKNRVALKNDLKAINPKGNLTGYVTEYKSGVLTLRQAKGPITPDCDHVSDIIGNLRKWLVLETRQVGLENIFLKYEDMKQEEVVLSTFVDEVVEWERFCTTKLRWMKTTLNEPNAAMFSDEKKEDDFPMIDCANCGRRHQRSKCPAFGKSCHKCGKTNHFSSVCRQKKPIDQKKKKQRFAASSVLGVAMTATSHQDTDVKIDDDIHTRNEADDDTEGTHSEDAEMLLDRAIQELDNEFAGNVHNQLLLEQAAQELDEEIPELISEEEFYRRHGHGDGGGFWIGQGRRLGQGRRPGQGRRLQGR